MLSQDQLDHYFENGYVIPDFRLPAETLAAIREDHDRLVQRHPEFSDYCSMLLRYDLSFLNYARNPAILDMVEQILGPDFALWNSSFFAKPARGGRRTPWHQDGEYWPIRPIATCTVWIAIDDSTPENGCLQVIPGSHKAKRLFKHRTTDSKDVTLNQELLASEFDQNEAVDLVLEAGQISLHDVFMVHGSAGNPSGKPRRGMTLRFMPTTSVFDRQLALEMHQNKKMGAFGDHSQRTLFLMRGVDRSGHNDFMIRQ
ncbi:MAG: phytanoyl-CoA dioxygenase family protein [Candidatus Competibacteraceae bacterium]|nr:phytanoyl-CoA dioxygenase family protein [Candidatus Competibacteraceae bacterium]MCB1811676.1 phytanoyl-CoA dioxygenase family protein [Candidatus Competibacteraceae bacterium]